jgi:hypothetical protein
MKELLHEIAGDLRTVCRKLEAEIACDEYRCALTGLVARGVITQADAERALGKIKEGEITW